MDLGVDGVLSSVFWANGLARPASVVRGGVFVLGWLGGGGGAGKGGPGTTLPVDIFYPSIF